MLPQSAAGLSPPSPCLPCPQSSHPTFASGSTLWPLCHSHRCHLVCTLPPPQSAAPPRSHTLAPSAKRDSPRSRVTPSTSNSTVPIRFKSHSAATTATRVTLLFLLSRCTFARTPCHASVTFVVKVSLGRGFCRDTCGLTPERSHSLAPTAPAHLPTSPTSELTFRHICRPRSTHAQDATRLLAG